MRAWLTALMVLPLAGCSTPGAPEPATAPTDVAVELDAFSGLPNPAWTLDAAEAGQLAARLQDLPRAREAGLAAGRLGYRGFWVRNPGGDGGVPENVYLSRDGVVLIFAADGSSEAWEDRRGAESLLRAVAERRGYADAVRR